MDQSTHHNGPRLRSDVVDVYIFRLIDDHCEFLRFLRAEQPLRGTWHPIMGHIEAGETAVQAALRELEEEAGLARTSPHLLGFWALEQVHPFYLAASNTIMLSPRFAARVSLEWSPRLCAEHAEFQWLPASRRHEFMWPGQRGASQEVIDALCTPGAPSEPLLRIDAPSVAR